MRFRIEFSLQAAADDDEEFVEIGFGSSTEEGALEACRFSVESILANQMWETTDDMLDPDEIGRWER